MDAISERPESPGDDYEWVALGFWRATPEPRRCRMQGRLHLGCGRPSVAEMARNRYQPNRRQPGSGKTITVWWPYCDAHIRDYGCRFEDGRVWAWQRKAED